MSIKTYEDVVRTDITMNESESSSVPVHCDGGHVVQSPQHIFGDLQCKPDGKSAFGYGSCFDGLGEVFALEKLHHNEQVVFVGGDEIVHADDVWVDEALRDAGLLDEHLFDLRVARVLRENPLHGIEIIGAISTFAAGPVDLGHAALGMQIQDLKSSDHDKNTVAAASSQSQNPGRDLRGL